MTPYRRAAALSRAHSPHSAAHVCDRDRHSRHQNAIETATAVRGLTIKGIEKRYDGAAGHSARLWAIHKTSTAGCSAVLVSFITRSNDQSNPPLIDHAIPPVRIRGDRHRPSSPNGLSDPVARHGNALFILLRSGAPVRSFRSRSGASSGGSERVRCRPGEQNGWKIFHLPLH